MRELLGQDQLFQILIVYLNPCLELNDLLGLYNLVIYFIFGRLLIYTYTYAINFTQNRLLHKNKLHAET